MLVYKAQSAHQPRKFDAIISEIKQIKPKAQKWLEEIPVRKQALAHDGGSDME